MIVGAPSTPSWPGEVLWPGVGGYGSHIYLSILNNHLCGRYHGRMSRVWYFIRRLRVIITIIKYYDNLGVSWEPYGVPAMFTGSWCGY